MLDEIQLQKRRSLIEKIEKAFQDAEFPGADLDKIGSRFEIMNIVGKTWQSVTLQDITTCQHLYFFKEQALVYYMPAYLKCVLEKPDDVWPDVNVALLVDLGDLDMSGNWRSPFDPICKYLTKEQRSVTIEFLEQYEDIFPFREKTQEEMDDILVLGVLYETGKSQRSYLVNRALRYWRLCQIEMSRQSNLPTK